MCKLNKNCTAQEGEPCTCGTHVPGFLMADNMKLPALHPGHVPANRSVEGEVPSKGANLSSILLQHLKE